MNVVCPNCKNPIRLSEDVIEKYKGRIVQITCKKCVKVFSCKIEVAPKIDDSDQTFIGANFPKFKLESGILEVPETVNNKSQTFVLNPGTNVIGRSPNESNARIADHAIVTKDSFMSKIHCCIEQIPARSGGFDFVLHDKGSRNKTWLNNEELGPEDKFKLKDGDEIKIGHTVIIFSTNSPDKTNLM